MSTHESPQAPPRRRRGVWIGLGILVLLVVIAAVVLPWLLDVERYRGHIEQALHAATGWDAELGAIDFSVLRGMSLTVRPARLSAPDGSSSFEIETIGIRAELWPLLRGELAVRSVELARPEIRLVRPSLERGWVLPLTPGDAAAEPTDRTATGSGLEVSVDEIRVSNGTLAIEDRAAAPPWSFVLDAVDITVQPTAGRMTGSGRLAGEGGRFEWQGESGQGLTLRLEEVRTEWLHPWLGDELVHGGGRLTGEFRVTLPLAVEGRVTGNDLVLLAGTEPLAEAQAEFAVAGREGVWSFERLSFETGGVRIAGAGPVYPALDLDVQLAPTPLEAVLRFSRSVLPLPLDLQPPGTVQAVLQVDQPVGGALTYAARGKVSAARFNLGAPLPPATDVAAEFRLERDNTLTVDVVDGRLGGGPITGRARLDSVIPPGRLSLEGGFRDAALGQLLAGMTPQAAERVSGPTGAQLRVRVDLSDEAFGLRDLGGGLELDARQVSLPGWDLERAIYDTLNQKLGALSQLVSLVDPARAAKLAGEVAADDAETRLLDDLRMRVAFDRWPWALEQLELAAGDLSASGSGTFDPDAGRVQVAFTARLDAERTAELVRKQKELRYLVDPQGRLAVPVEIEGPLLSPSIRVDVGDLLLQQLGGDSPEDALKGLLKGLLGKDKKKETP